ncbi:dihydroxyacetone kinase subunit DhaL [Streptomyces palmae]|uniref:Dihydroxyacetone kinase subunit L n=1 Tax=Streptomyces palmae TaxID=1701085 RepID=A0A4Z0HJ62_9ACTN|nr:dihydroxyacetone kinase subunit DhaL [Streptomyces palmae]TGB18045.1 dihydroxyacetone kinase subunit L [Streptomyces palmae]
MEYDGTYTRAWIRRFAESVAATEPELTRLDQRAGDGDFGTNLRTGLALTLRELRALPAGPLPASAPLEATARTFLDGVGGTSGPLFGLLFQELADAVAQAGPALDVHSLAAGTAAGLAAIQRVGEAQPGDKTLVDALVPAVEELRHCPPGTRPDQALAAAARGSWQGVHSTALLRAHRGRASYLGERASGVPDPGAVGVALFFSTANARVTSLRAQLVEPGRPGREEAAL